MSVEQDHPTHAAPKFSRQRKRWLLLLCLIFIFFGFLFFLYWFFISRFYESTDDAYVSGNLVQVMPQISGHVIKVLADETDLVKEDDPLVNLDAADTSIALKNAETKLALVARQVSQYYENVDQLEAKVAEQKANLNKAKEDLERRQGLVVNQTISREDLQHAKLAVDSATATLNLAQNELEGAINLVSNSDLYHHPQILEAANNLRNAYLNFQRTTIYAPETGYVAKRNVQVGQYVTPTTILMVIVPLNQVWVDANFKESQLKHIRIGQPVELYADAYGDNVVFHGTVAGLSPGTGSTFDLLPPQNATGNWIKIVQRLPVRITIDENELAAHPLRLGLSMLVKIKTLNRQGPELTALREKKILHETKDPSSDIQKTDQLINDILQKNAKNVSYSGDKK